MKLGVEGGELTGQMFLFRFPSETMGTIHPVVVIRRTNYKPASLITDFRWQHVSLSQEKKVDRCR